MNNWIELTKVIILGLTLIASCFTIYFSRKASKQANDIESKKINADLISKSRLKWMDKLSNNAIDLVDKAHNLSINIYTNNEKHKINKLELINLEKSLNSLRIMFPDSNNYKKKFILTEDFTINNMAEKGRERFHKNETFINNLMEMESTKNMDANINNLIVELSDYYSRFITNDNYILSRTYYNSINGAETQERELSKVVKYTIQLAIILGIYLKLEWKVVKLGK